MLVLGASAHIRAGLNAPHRPVASLTGHLTKGPLLLALVGEVSPVMMRRRIPGLCKENGLSQPP